MRQKTPAPPNQMIYLLAPTYEEHRHYVNSPSTATFHMINLLLSARLVVDDARVLRHVVVGSNIILGPQNMHIRPEYISQS